MKPVLMTGVPESVVRRRARSLKLHGFEIAAVSCMAILEPA
jgi:hypothetical protein